MTAQKEKQRTLLTPDFLRKLDQLDLLYRKILAGNLGGDRPDPRPIASAALLPIDYRPYTPGDDPRLVDWNIFARLDKLFVKLFAQEQDLSLHLLLDASKSCDYGRPNKFLYLTQIAAALGYVALTGGHHVSINAIGNGTSARCGTLRGRAAASAMINFLTSLNPRGISRFSAECARFCAAQRRPGICVVLSDFLFPGGPADGLNYLLAARHDLLCIQALSPQELQPDFAAAETDMEITDLEQPRAAHITVTPRLLNEYQVNLKSHCQAVSQAVLGRGGNYVFTSTARPFDRLVLDHLRRRGLLG